MRDNARLFATLIIWIGFTIMFSTTMTSVTGPLASASGAALFGIILVLALMATISTLAIWLGTPNSSPAESDTSRSKAKRAGGGRIERLVEQLDDEDIYELEAMLLARDRGKDVPTRRE